MKGSDLIFGKTPVLFMRKKTFPSQFKKKLIEEIQTVLRKGVICEAEPETGQILSNVFLQEKKD